MLFLTLTCKVVLLAHFQIGMSKRVVDVQMHQQLSGSTSVVAPTDLVGLCINHAGQIASCMSGPAGKTGSYCKFVAKNTYTESNQVQHRLRETQGKLLMNSSSQWGVQKIVKAGVAWKKLSSSKPQWWDRLPEKPSDILERLSGRWYSGTAKMLQITSDQVCVLNAHSYQLEDCQRPKIEKLNSQSYLRFGDWVILDSKWKFEDDAKISLQVHLRLIDGTVRDAHKGPTDAVWNQLPDGDNSVFGCQETKRLIGTWMSDEGQVITCSTRTCEFYIYKRPSIEIQNGTSSKIQNEGTAFALVSGRQKYVCYKSVGSTVIFKRSTIAPEDRSIFAKFTGVQRHVVSDRVRWNRLSAKPEDVKAKIVADGPWINMNGEITDTAGVQVVGPIVLYSDWVAVDILESRMGTVVKWQQLANPSSTPELDAHSTIVYWYQDKPTSDVQPAIVKSQVRQPRSWTPSIAVPGWMVS